MASNSKPQQSCFDESSVSSAVSGAPTTTNTMCLGNSPRLEGFNLFPKLPLELQSVIWGYLSPGVRTVEIEVVVICRHSLFKQSRLSRAYSNLFLFITSK